MFESTGGRDLHEFLEVKTRYNDWFERMTEYGFEVNFDFIELTQKRVTSHGRPYEQVDHHIKLDMAKEIAMIQRTEKGKQARQYFLQLEKMWNSPEMASWRITFIMRHLQVITKVKSAQLYTPP